MHTPPIEKYSFLALSLCLPFSATAQDTDGDGLADAEEITLGTNPNLADSDSDGIDDWYEVKASLTNPNSSSSKPDLPYPLLSPGNPEPSSNKPVKVFILVGQSNMVGFGWVDGVPSGNSGTAPLAGSLEDIVKSKGKFPNLFDNNTNDWLQRNDVFLEGSLYTRGAIDRGKLQPGFAAMQEDRNFFGPELGFGHVLGYHFDEPVLLIKVPVGARSLGGDYLPPGSPNFGEFYGTRGRYLGNMFDRSFRDEADHAPNGGTQEHNLTDALDNFNTIYPQWADQGFQISGIAWWQGFGDRINPDFYNNYETNLVNLIKESRSYLEQRYPDNIEPNCPFVLATFAGRATTQANPTGGSLVVRNAQLAVDGDAGNYPEFSGNVKTVDAEPFRRTFGPAFKENQWAHYNWNAETYLFVGDSLGRAMVNLLPDETPRETLILEAENFDTYFERDPDINRGGVKDFRPETGVEFVTTGDGGIGVSMTNNEWIAFNIDLPDGDYRVSILAANGNQNRNGNASISLNDVPLSNLSVGFTGGFWTYQEIGDDIVTISNAQDASLKIAKGTGPLRIDKIILTPVE